MANRITIEEATVRDLTFVLYNLREADIEELHGLFPAALNKESILNLIVDGCMNGLGYVAKIDTQPVAAFGVSIQFHQGIGWAFGTNRFNRAVPAMTKHIINKLSHQLMDYGLMRLEVRPLTKHMFARNWLCKIGFKEDCELKFYGSSGESYHLYSMTLDDYSKKFSKGFN